MGPCSTGVKNAGYSGWPFSRTKKWRSRGTAIAKTRSATVHDVRIDPDRGTGRHDATDPAGQSGGCPNARYPKWYRSPGQPGSAESRGNSRGSNYRRRTEGLANGTGGWKGHWHKPKVGRTESFGRSAGRNDPDATWRRKGRHTTAGWHRWHHRGAVHAIDTPVRRIDAAQVGPARHSRGQHRRTAAGRDPGFRWTKPGRPGAAAKHTGQPGGCPNACHSRRRWHWFPNRIRDAKSRDDARSAGRHRRTGGLANGIGRSEGHRRKPRGLGGAVSDRWLRRHIGARNAGDAGQPFSRTESFGWSAGGGVPDTTRRHTTARTGRNPTAGGHWC